MSKVESLDYSSDVSANNPEKCETVESVEIERNELGKVSPSLRKLKVEDLDEQIDVSTKKPKVCEGERILEKDQNE